MKCLFHSDADGMCAGAIVYWYYQAQGVDCEMFSVNYNEQDKIHEILDSIETDEKLFIVDFSIEVKDMEKLLKRGVDVTWIDHHVSSIDKYKDFLKNHEVSGYRDLNRSGCALTWLFFQPQAKMPRVVELIEDRDIWKFQYGDETRQFNMGLQTENIFPSEYIWVSLFENKSNLIEQKVEEGKIILKYRDQWAADYRKSWAFETEFEGHNCIAMNLGKCGSEYFGDDFENYDIAIAYVFDGKQFVISLYSTTVDVSKIAEKYKGGGHRGAAGFSIVGELPCKPKKAENKSAPNT